MSDREDWIWQEDERERAEIRRRLAGEAVSPIRAASDAMHAEPPAVAIGEIKALAEKARLKMASTVCEGFSENLSLCHEWTEAACPEREAPGCPRRIAAYKRSMARNRGEALSPVELYVRSGIPRGIAETLADGVEDRPAMQEATAWWNTKPRPRVLVLSGANQIGKSVAAASLCSDWHGMFCYVPEWREVRLWDDAYARSLLTPGLLVLDDLGAENEKPEFSTRLAGVFCARVDGGTFTVITTNSPDGIRKRYGDRVAERIRTHGRARSVARTA